MVSYFKKKVRKLNSQVHYADFLFAPGSLKPDITVAEQEDGTVPQAIVKCILFLQEHRDLPTLYKGLFFTQGLGSIELWTDFDK